MSHHKVHLENVSFYYEDGTLGLKDINLHIHHGESVGIIGANGMGKSTLLKVLTGLLIAKSGQITIGETLLTPKNLPYIRQELGYTFQEADHQLFMNKVKEDVGFGPKHQGLDKASIEERVNNALERVDALHLKQRYTYRLSGGEKRSVAIATVLAMDPSVLLMDEPAVGLDPKSRRNLIDFLKGYEHTKMVVTHDLDMVWEICPRVVVLFKGEIVYDGPTETILKDQQFLEKHGLALPIRFQ